MTENLRIVSLLPSATEIIAALGLVDCLVGRSHECDYPAEVVHLPACTEPKFSPEGSSGDIHHRVMDVLQSALSVYRVDTKLLQQLQPTHIITQAQCEVCAVSLSDVEQAVATLTQVKPQIISLQPQILADVWQDMERVATHLGVSAEAAIASLKQRVVQCQQQTVDLPEAERPSVICIEWVEPLMAAGNWIPELVHLAGGRSLYGMAGQHSPWISSDLLQDLDPDVILFMPCGFDLHRTRRDASQLAQAPWWNTLRAVQQGRVYLTDGNQYFNRSGPRLVDSLEILAEILHPEHLNYGYEGIGWIHWQD